MAYYVEMNVIKKIIAVLVLFVFFADTVHAASITYEFSAPTKLTNGTIVSLDTKTKTVSKTVKSTVDQMYGVIANAGDISISDTGQSQKVPVATTGVVPTLVSTANGDINIGDPITVQSIEGIGERAIRSGRVVGIAQSNFTDRSKGAKKVTTTSKGVKHDVYVGFVDVKVSASDYTPATALINQRDARNRNMLEKIADNLTGKIVKPMGLIIAGLVLLVGIFVSAFLITSSSYSSMIAIGRNPLAEKKVLRSLVGLILLSIGIFCLSAGLAYGVLKILG